MVLAPCRGARSSLVRRLFGAGVGNISSEGFRVDDMNPPLLLDTRVESWCLGAGVWGKYLKILVTGLAMALLIAAFSIFFFLPAVLLLESVGSSFSPLPPASHCSVKKCVALRDCREQLTEQSRKFFVLLRNGMMAFLPEGKTKFEQQGAWRMFVSITVG